jgi:hypothetical protein
VQPIFDPSNKVLAFVDIAQTRQSIHREGGHPGARYTDNPSCERHQPPRQTKSRSRKTRPILCAGQFLLVRRAVVGFLSFTVILFGFVTQFNSLATFAGFITSGIAVGLQTILLSVAAYFFIIGRYGVKVGEIASRYRRSPEMCSRSAWSAFTGWNWPAVELR